MTAQRYSVNQYLIETIMTWVKSGEIAIPEIQRPFVWEAAKVRDLMDSLYQGYPVGYIIAWRNPSVKLKDGGMAEGKKILIDGQQRVTALRAAIGGQQVVNQDYRTVRIRIAFHPLDERFEVANTAIDNDKSWITDIGPVIRGDTKTHKVVRQYLDANPDADEDLLYDRLDKLTDILKKQIGLIELSHDLDIETVTEIFIRINSKGVVLSQADFAMSKIAANEEFGGNRLRKAVDYFCHLAVAPEFYSVIEENDKEFAATDYFKAMRWLRQENEDLYDPGYSDMLRVAFTSRFNRGKLADLVGLLSGRNFETRTYEKDIEEASFQNLHDGVMEFINETRFKRFLMIIRSAGFVDKSMIRSGAALNFAYSLYLKLKRDHGNEPRIESWVRRWFVMSVLTGRYSASRKAGWTRTSRISTRGGSPRCWPTVRPPSCQILSGRSGWCRGSEPPRSTHRCSKPSWPLRPAWATRAFCPRTSLCAICSPTMEISTTSSHANSSKSRATPVASTTRWPTWRASSRKLTSKLARRTRSTMWRISFSIARRASHSTG
ncbi:hypothetical protein ASALC70_00768 [Alcanivorax sp. ALC70]|nr:hypothetical protein ASALC70_00768 [Alcanivorax sp. ALC70]